MHAALLLSNRRASHGTAEALNEALRHKNGGCVAHLNKKEKNCPAGSQRKLSSGDPFIAGGKSVSRFEVCFANS